MYALIIGMLFYRTIALKDILPIIRKTLKLSALSLFALSTASALGELLGYYNVSARAAEFFESFPGGVNLFMLFVIAFFLFVGTFMDAVPAMILFVPVILPAAAELSVDPVHMGVVVVMTLALGLVTPPYGLCLLIAGSIGKLTIEKSFRGILPFFLIAVAVLILTALLPGLVIGLPRLINPGIF